MVFHLLIILIKSLGYLGVFLVSLISTSTIFLPLPLYSIDFIITALGFNPLLVGISAGLGSALGEFTGYFVGAGSAHILEKDEGKKSFKKHSNRFFRKFLNKLDVFFAKYGFWAILLAAALPFPFDFVGILAGASKYDVKKFFLATFIGKTIKNLLIAYAGVFIGTPFFDFIKTTLQNELS